MSEAALDEKEEPDARAERDAPSVCKEPAAALRCLASLALEDEKRAALVPDDQREKQNSQEGYPPAIVSWFYPGENLGWSFIYPRASEPVEE